MLLCFFSSLEAAEFRLFANDSLKEITVAREGRPFLLVLWSVDCPSCLKELEDIGHLKSQFSADGLVLISTDNEDYADEAQQILIRYGLTDVDSWRFAGNFPERLRYQIDPNWYGELPRAYFYDANHERVGRSGALSPELLKRFISSHKN